MRLDTLIEQLGYSPHEATVYLTALELGGSTETEIAEKAGFPRTTVVAIIEALHKKGLMSAFFKGRRKIWSAENPEKLVAVLREREAMLAAALPEFHSLRRDTDVKPTIHAYSGAEEIKQIMSDIIETKHHVSALMSWDDWVRLLGESFLNDFIELRKRHFLRVRLLTPKTKLSLILRQRDAAESRVTQFLPEGIAVNNCNFIYNDKVAIISSNTKPPIGILIEDKSIHHTMDVFFESLWLRSGGDQIP